MATGELAASGSVSAQAQTRPNMAYAALIAGVLCISFTAIFTKLAQVPGPVAAAYRMTIATAVLTLPLAWHLHRVGRPRTGVRWGVTGGLWFALNLGLLSSALLRTSAANATLLDNTAPIWVGLGALIFFHERLGRRYWAGLALALAGAAVVSGFRLAGGVSLNAGDVMAFVGAVFYAGYLLNTQRARRDLDSLTYLWLVAANIGRCLGWLLFGGRAAAPGLQSELLSVSGRAGCPDAGGRLAVDHLRPGALARLGRGGCTTGPAGGDWVVVDSAVGRSVGHPPGDRRRAATDGHRFVSVG